MSKYTYLATLDEMGRIIGFTSMNTEGYMHAIFVHKNWQGKGVAKQLLLEAKKMANKYRVQRIWAEISITARPFFERHGYKAVK